MTGAWHTRLVCKVNDRGADEWERILKQPLRPPPLYLKHSTGVGGGIPQSFGLHPDVYGAVQTAGWVDPASSWRKHQTINYRGGHHWQGGACASGSLARIHPLPHPCAASADDTLVAVLWPARCRRLAGIESWGGWNMTVRLRVTRQHGSGLACLRQAG